MLKQVYSKIWIDDKILSDENSFLTGKKKFEKVKYIFKDVLTGGSKRFTNLTYSEALKKARRKSRDKRMQSFENFIMLNTI